MALQQRCDDSKRFLGRAGSLQAEADQIHPQQRGRLLARPVDGPDLFVPDRDPVFVDPVLDAPQPRRSRTEECVGAGVGDGEVLRAKRRAGRAPGVPLDHLRFVGMSVGILREQHRAVRANAQRVAHLV